MTEPQPCIMTISRLLGSGGSSIGHRLAALLGVLCADREIVTYTARQLHVSESVVEERDESVTPLWLSLLEAFQSGNPAETYSPPPLYVPTDAELRAAEAEVIVRLAQTRSAVIIGRGGFYVLRENPRHFSVFLHADPAFRLRRVQEEYGLTEHEAEEQIERHDCARARYHQSLTGRDWSDARQYHLCLDTGALGIEQTINLLASCWRRRFGEPCAD